MSLHGISGPAWKRYLAGGKWYYEIEAPGYKYNMTDLAAAIGLVQLDRVHPYYQRIFGYRPEDFPVALDLYERSVSLPIYPKMSDGDIDAVIEAVRGLALS